MKVTAKTHWVWTELAQQTWDNRYKGQRREAGKPIRGTPEESVNVDPAWIKRSYVIDSTEYVKEGQLTLFEI